MVDDMFEDDGLETYTVPSGLNRFGWVVGGAGVLAGWGGVAIGVLLAKGHGWYAVPVAVAMAVFVVTLAKFAGSCADLVMAYLNVGHFDYARYRYWFLIAMGKRDEAEEEWDAYWELFGDGETCDCGCGDGADEEEV